MSRSSIMLVAALALLAPLVSGCASGDASDEGIAQLGAPVRATYPPVPGEEYVRASGRTVLCQTAELEVPLHLESELFVVADKVARDKDADRKRREGLGHARVKFAEGIEIREAERILVTFSDCDRIRVVARGNVVFIDQEAGRVVRNASTMRIEGNNVRFEGPYRVERLTEVPSAP